MNIFSENLQITSFYFKEQSPKGDLKIYIFYIFYYAPKIIKLVFD